MSSNEASSEAEGTLKDNSKNKVISKKGTIMKSNYYAVKLGKNNKLYISLNSKKNEENDGESDNESAGTGTDTDSFGDEEESEDIGINKDVDSQTADSDIVDLSRNDLEVNNGVQDISYVEYGSNDDKFNDVNSESLAQVDKNFSKSIKRKSKNEKNPEKPVSIKKRKIAHILDSAEESLTSVSSTPIVTGYPLEHMPPQSSYSSTPARRTSKRSTILDSVEVEEAERKEELKKQYNANLKTDKSNFQNDPVNEFSTANNQSKNSELRDGFSSSISTEKKNSENFKYNKIKLKLTNINSDLLGLLDNADKKPKAKKRGKPPKKVQKKLSDNSTAGSVEPVDHNEDFCSACGGIGNFLCCEGCPKSFHLECLNPPLEEDELPEGDWFCNHCIIRKLKEQHIKLPTVNGIFGKLIINMKKKNPRKFDLPSGIWQRFEGVSKGKYGEFSVENEYYKEIVGKKGLQQAQAVHIYDSQIDDENPENVTISTISTNVTSEHNNAKSSSETFKSESLPKPLFCYQCGKSGLHTNKNLIKCEYCPLVWHLDCLNPPLSSIKILGKKWKCPNHIDDLINQNSNYVPNIPKFSNGGLKVKDRTNLDVCVSRKFSNNGYNFEIISDIKKPSKIKVDNSSSKKEEDPNEIRKQTSLFDNVSQLDHDFKSTTLSKRKFEGIEKSFDTNNGVGAVIRTKYWKNYTLSPKYGDFGKGEKQIFEDDNNDSIIYRYPESSVILDFVDSVKEKRQREIDNFNSRTMCIFNQIVDSINNHEQNKSSAVLELSKIETARNLLEFQCRSKIMTKKGNPLSPKEINNEVSEEQKISLFIKQFGKEKILSLLENMQPNDDT